MINCDVYDKNSVVKYVTISVFVNQHKFGSGQPKQVSKE